MPNNHDILGALLKLAETDKRFAATLRAAASNALDKHEAGEWRQQLKVANSRFTRKGDRRSIETVRKGEATKLRKRRNRARLRGNARREVQGAELGARRFRRKLSAKAAVLRAMAPGQWYLRADLRAACPELPGDTLSALLGQGMLSHTRPWSNGPLILNGTACRARCGRRGSTSPLSV